MARHYLKLYYKLNIMYNKMHSLSDVVKSDFLRDTLALTKLSPVQN